MPNPSSFMSHPMMCSVFRQHHSPLARMRGPARDPFLVLRRSRPAAPSPNSAVDTNITGLGSLTRRHRLQRSTVRNRTCAPSFACARRAARARPATPPPQPNPNIGNRSIVGASLSRLSSRASRLGTASPVTVLVRITSIASSGTPAASVTLIVTCSNRSSACRWKDSVRSSQLCGLRYHSIGSQLYLKSMAVLSKRGHSFLRCG